MVYTFIQMLIHTFSNNNYPTIHAYNNLREAGLISQWAGLAARGLSASGRSLAATDVFDASSEISLRVDKPAHRPRGT